MSENIDYVVYQKGFDDGVKKGRADAIEEYVTILQKQLDSYAKHHELLEKLIEQLKEQNDE